MSRTSVEATADETVIIYLPTGVQAGDELILFVAQYNTTAGHVPDVSFADWGNVFDSTEEYNVLHQIFLGTSSRAAVTGDAGRSVTLTNCAIGADLEVICVCYATASGIDAENTVHSVGTTVGVDVTANNYGERYVAAVASLDLGVGIDAFSGQELVVSVATATISLTVSHEALIGPGLFGTHHRTTTLPESRGWIASGSTILARVAQATASTSARRLHKFSGRG